MMAGMIWLRHITLIVGCGALGGVIWTELAPVPPVNGGILAPAGVLVGAVVGGAISAITAVVAG